jgi:hypothetical protein
MNRKVLGGLVESRENIKQLLAKFGRSLHVSPPPFTVVSELQMRAVTDSADMIDNHLQIAQLVSTHAKMQEMVAKKLPTLGAGLFLEFGYFEGSSALIFSKALRGHPYKAILHSFDAFEGLRDGWSQIDHTVGAFDRNGIAPMAPPGVVLVVGWVEQTLTPFLSDHPGDIKFVHFDMDVYEPTRFALEKIRPRLVTGSLLLFDELHGYPGWRNFEWRALNEVLSPDEYEFVAFGPEQALLAIK